MSVFDDETTMLLILRFLADGQVRKTSEIVDYVANHFSLKTDHMKELMPSSRAKLVNTRVGWACTCLRKEGLILAPRRAYKKITDDGLNAIAQRPERIDTAFLSKFRQSKDFQEQNRSSSKFRIQSEVAVDVPDTMIAHVTGSADIVAMADGGYRAITELLRMRFVHLVCDLSELKHASPLMMSLLKYGERGTRTRGGLFILCGIPDQTVDVLVSIGWDSMYYALKDVQDALRSIVSPADLEVRSNETWRALREPLYQRRREELYARRLELESARPKLPHDPNALQYALRVLSPPFGCGDCIAELSGDLIDDDRTRLIEHIHWIASFGPRTITVIMNEIHRFDLPVAVAVTEVARWLGARGIRFSVRSHPGYTGLPFSDNRLLEVMAPHVDE